MGGDVVFKPGVPGFPPGASCRAVPKKPPAEAWGLRVAGRRAADEIAERGAVGAVHLHVPAEAVADPGDESWGELSSFLDIARRVVAKQALAIEKRMPADALPPVSLYRGLAAYWELCCDGPGVPPQSGSIMSLWLACPDIFWTRWAMEAVRRDENRFGNMTLPEYCLLPLDQPDQPVTRTAIRWLWIGWNNREQWLHTAVVRRTVNLIRQFRLDSDAVVDVFESMNPCDWWHPPRLPKAFTSMVEMAPESASFFGNVIGGCVAVFPPELRGVRQLAQLGAAWRQAP